MDRPRSPSRRVLGFLASTALGILGAVAVASPAGAAAPTQVSGSCAWDPATNEWVVSWTIDGDTPAELTEVEITPEESQLQGVEPGSPYGPDEPLTAEQRVPEDASSAALTVRAETESGEVAGGGAIQIPADCEAPDGPEPTGELGEWMVSCTALTITVANPTAEELALTFAPSAGEPVDVAVAGDESATVQFPPSEGLTVDVLVNGEPAQFEEPIAITPGALADLNCDEADDDGGGGGLPATGTSVALFAGGAVVLLALGAGLYLLARRRRVTFTA